MSLNSIRTAFDQLNHDYLAVHRAKEDRFWSTNMGTDTDDAGFVAAEQAWTAFLSSPERLMKVRELRAELADLEDSAEKRALEAGLLGWQNLFECHIVETEEARRAWDEVLRLEAAIFAKRREYQPRHLDDNGALVPASLGALIMEMTTNPDEKRRQSSFEGLKELERWVLANGFLDIVRARNAFARLQGYENYFEYKVRKTESLTGDELFVILDEFEALTRDAQARSLDELCTRGGETALRPWNQRFYASGDTTAELDPYFSFTRAVSVWTESFRRLGITYRQATLTLDLLERTGKHENGFCHGPVPSFFDGDQWVPAVVNFTSEANPGQVGSGYRALETLFHEGGHAAHFANVTGNSPCFSQEFAPTSMAYAETQSMFLDSLIRDADWMMRYARSADGSALPEALIRKEIVANQPFRVVVSRGILAMPMFERALYRLADAELTAERVLALARKAEVDVFGTEGRRPTLAVPHLLNQESAASYQGYLLAEMAVAQTRAWFLEKYGYLADNPAIGPLLAQHYWAPGNAVSHDATLRALMGQGFSGRALAEDLNRTVDQAWADAQAKMAAAKTRAYPDPPNASLEASIRVVDGNTVVANNEAGDAALGRAFEAWVNQRLASANQRS